MITLETFEHAWRTIDTLGQLSGFCFVQWVKSERPELHCSLQLAVLEREKKEKRRALSQEKWKIRGFGERTEVSGDKWWFKFLL